MRTTLKNNRRILVRDLIIETVRVGNRTVLEIEHTDGEPVQIIVLPEKPIVVEVSEAKD